MVSQDPDPFGQHRTLSTRWFDAGMKATALLLRRRVWLTLWLVFVALMIIGVVADGHQLAEELGPG